MKPQIKPAMPKRSWIRYINNYESADSLRQSVAQAIASEKRLEQSIYKNKEQVSTWQNRAQMALEQNNNDLASQAEERATNIAKPQMNWENSIYSDSKTQHC